MYVVHLPSPSSYHTPHPSLTYQLPSGRSYLILVVLSSSLMFYGSFVYVDSSAFALFLSDSDLQKMVFKKMVTIVMGSRDDLI